VSTEPLPRTIEEGKETVVRAPGRNWSFHLPKGHGVELAANGRSVVLAAGGMSSIYTVDGIEHLDPGEVVLRLGELRGKSGPASSGFPVEAHGYPIPMIQEEFDRLRERWANAGLNEQEFNAWEQGSDWERQLRRIRARLREAERPGLPERRLD
jgi:hypothetical protein